MVNEQVSETLPPRLKGQLLDTSRHPVGLPFAVRLTLAVDGHTKNEQTIPIIIPHTGVVDVVRLYMDGEQVGDVPLTSSYPVNVGDVVEFAPGALTITFDGGRVGHQALQRIVEASWVDGSTYIINEEPSLDDLSGSLFEPVS